MGGNVGRNNYMEKIIRFDYLQPNNLEISLPFPGINSNKKT